MTVLVTGATGFTGGHLARMLAARGYQVRALVRPSQPDEARRDSRSQRPASTLMPGDLTDAAAVARACEGVTVVYHIAATYREAGQPDSAYRAINVDGTRNVIDGARKAGARRVVHCSTGGVHGHIEHPPANEDAPLRPGDIYQETKLEAEQLAREFGDARRGLEVIIARPIGIYGPGDTRFLKMFRGIATRPLSDARLGRGVLSPHLHRRSLRGVHPVRRSRRRPRAAPTSSAGRGTRRSNELARLMARGAGREAAAGCGCRCGRSGPPDCCAR